MPPPPPPQELLPDVGLSAKNSLSLRRAPGPPGQSLRGNATNFPFWPGKAPPKSLWDLCKSSGAPPTPPPRAPPGGLDEPSLEQIRTHGDEEEDVDFETGRSPPPTQFGVSPVLRVFPTPF